MDWNRHKTKNAFHANNLYINNTADVLLQKYFRTAGTEEEKCQLYVLADLFNIYTIFSILNGAYKKWV